MGDFCASSEVAISAVAGGFVSVVLRAVVAIVASQSQTISESCLQSETQHTTTTSATGPPLFSATLAACSRKRTSVRDATCGDDLDRDPRSAGRSDRFFSRCAGDFEPRVPSLSRLVRSLILWISGCLRDPSKQSRSNSHRTDTMARLLTADLRYILLTIFTPRQPH